MITDVIARLQKLGRKTQTRSICMCEKHFVHFLTLWIFIKVQGRVEENMSVWYRRSIPIV